MTYSFTKEKVEQLDGLIKGHAEHLTELHVSVIIFTTLQAHHHQYQHLLGESGLLDIILAIDHDDGRVSIILNRR
jgi:hypothetical protein